jgi:predicted enzyme related to lactoylglutathione lyase
VDNAEEIRNFYCDVVGWTYAEVNQGEYNDFNILNLNNEEEVVAGICHKRGEVANFPSQWLNYLNIENLDSSLNKCRPLGGQIIVGPTKMGNANHAVIQDPAGDYLALMEE